MCQLFHRMASRPHSVRGGQSELNSDHVGRWSEWYIYRDRQWKTEKSSTLESNRFSFLFLDDILSLCVCLSESIRVLVCLCVSERCKVFSSLCSAGQELWGVYTRTPAVQPKRPRIIHTHSILPLHELYEIYTGCLMLRENTGQTLFTESLLLNVWLLPLWT